MCLSSGILLLEARKLAFLGHALETFFGRLDPVREILAFDRQQTKNSNYGWTNGSPRRMKDHALADFEPVRCHVFRQILSYATTFARLESL
jgi:hypothetical protein